MEKGVIVIYFNEHIWKLRSPPPYTFFICICVRYIMYNICICDALQEKGPYSTPADFRGEAFKDLPFPSAFSC